MGLCCGKKAPKKRPEGLDPAAVLLQHKDEGETPDVVVDPDKEAVVKFEQKGVLHVREELLIFGMAILRQNIYVLSRNPSTISIHKSEEPFDHVSDLPLEELDTPWDIASSLKCDCLYITDCGSNTIFKMAAASNELTPWLNDMCYPHTLSVIEPDDQVLIVKNGNPSSLEVLDPEAKLSQRVELPDEIEYPKHAVRSTAGNFFVIGKVKETECWRVFELTSEGEILRKTTESLAECYHLASGFADRVIVADIWKNRMLVFDAELKRCQALELGFSWPWRIQYVGAENQLYVLTSVKPHKDILTANASAEKDDEKEETADSECHGAICIYSLQLQEQ